MIDLVYDSFPLKKLESRQENRRLSESVLAQRPVGRGSEQSFCERQEQLRRGSPEKSQAYTKPEANPGNWSTSQANPECDCQRKGISAGHIATKARRK
jgi:hypothetical protein